jgi:peptide chain release factor subunit 1
MALAFPRGMTAPSTMLEAEVDRLAAFEPSSFPVISLYLDMRSDEHGRDHCGPFVRKELRARARSYALRSPERESFERDLERIEGYLASEVTPSANGLALFASSGTDGFFEAFQLAAPLEHHSLHVGRQPQLYPLVRLMDAYRPAAALVADTHQARIYVFGVGRAIEEAVVTGVKTRRSHGGGWSQARYQRHVDHFRQQHAREAVDTLERIVEQEGVERVVLSGDQVIVPLVRAEMSKALSARVVDELALDIRAPEDAVFRATFDAVRAEDERGDRDTVTRLVDEYRAGALGVVGARDTLIALEAGRSTSSSSARTRPASPTTWRPGTRA